MKNLTELWLNGYHEQAITHGLNQTMFRHQLTEMGYSSPELDQLSDQLEQELERMNMPTEITIKPELFTRNSKIPIKHMIQVLDGDFAFSPFKCRKRASALV